LKTLNLDKFKKAYLEQTGRTIVVAQLENIGLVQPERDKKYPTHAALLFSDSSARKRYFPYAKVECARFKGKEPRTFLDQATIDEPIHAAAEPCMAFIKKNISLGSTIGEIYRKDRWEYPLEAIREALINAIIHRDYSILGSDIKVAIYDDMLEITSPGPLPDALSIEELGSGRSEIRNRVLAPVFKDLKLIEAWGTGIRKMKNELDAYSDIELVFHEVGHAFQVQFRKKETKGTKKAPSRDQAGTKQGPSRDQVGSEQEPSNLWLSGNLGEKHFQILEECIDGKPMVVLMKIFNRSNRTKFKNSLLDPLINKGFLEMTVPDSPKSPTQKYRTTAKGIKIIKATEFE